MVKEVVKVRTSITIDPSILSDVRKETETNVSAFIEEACRRHLEYTRSLKKDD